MPTGPIALDALPDLIDGEPLVSDWIDMPQARINDFANATDDHQFIHVDPDLAATTPFGGTIAHGFLTLSMLSALASAANVSLDGAVMGVNYGFERVRFIEPVPSGSRIRASFQLAAASEKDAGRWLLRFNALVEIEGHDKPALAAEWLVMQIVGATVDG